jgi:pimeloyl-ACP methyl ester carboxylesterase
MKQNLIVALLVTTATLGCSSLLYYPSNIVYVDTERLEVPPQECEFKSGDQTIRAWYFQAPKPAKAVIALFHGNAQNRSSHFAGLYWLVKEGYDLFVFDYPGYADSTGSPDPENTVAAGVAALRYLQNQNVKLPIVVYGQSLGGAVALRSVVDAKDDIHPLLVVADSTFLSYQRVARKTLSSHWFTWMLQPLVWLTISDRYAPGDSIAAIPSTPILVIHSKTDQVVPFQQGEQVFAVASQPKEFWPLEKSPHIEGFVGPEGVQTRKRFLKKLNELSASR